MQQNPQFRQFVISIHAPRGGSDHLNQQQYSRDQHFNPRSPWGERQQICTTAPLQIDRT